MTSPRRVRFAWYLYDWANSAFSASVIGVFIGPYLTTLARAAADGDGMVSVLGLRVFAGSFYPYAVALSVFLQMLVLPAVGVAADRSSDETRLLGGFAFAGAAATVALALPLGYRGTAACFVVANVCFGASVVVYNAFLPALARPDERDAVSSVGWAIGYLGGGLLLGLNLLLLTTAPAWGLTTAEAVRVSLASAGLWWALFTVLVLRGLRHHPVDVAKPAPTTGRRSSALTALPRTIAELRRYPWTLLLLLAVLLYNDGIQAVFALAAQFGQEELGLSVGTLTQVILMVQFVAFAGALLFGHVARWLGAKRAVILSLIIWIVALGYVAGALRTQTGFFLVAAVIGVVQGGSQALSRSLYSQVIPRDRAAAYFGLYEAGERGTSWLAPLAYGVVLQISGSYRLAVLSLTIFFALGLALLAAVDVGRGVATAETRVLEGSRPGL